MSLHINMTLVIVISTSSSYFMLFYTTLRFFHGINGRDILKKVLVSYLVSLSIHNDLRYNVNTHSDANFNFNFNLFILYHIHQYQEYILHTFTYIFIVRRRIQGPIWPIRSFSNGTFTFTHHIWIFLRLELRASDILDLYDTIINNG